MYESLPPPVDRPRRILVVDGDEARCRLLAALFRHEGYEVEALFDADTLVDTVRQKPPDLILLDVELPRVSGLELCGDLRMYDELRLTPIVLTTSTHADEDSVVRGLLSGADDYVSASGRLAELKARVRVQLRNRRDRELLQWTEAQRERLRNAAMCDPLTGLPNRRGADRAVGDALNSGDPLMLLVVDIDHFKRINDTHGHPMGDMVLQEVARTLQRRTRKGDVVARFGGEEFLVVISGVGPQMAAQIGERYRSAVRNMVIDPKLGIGPVTISIGVACWEPPFHKPGREHLFAVADAALYEAKRSGRDRVMIKTIEAPEPVGLSPGPVDSVRPSRIPERSA